jgi:hypothetical protein
MADKVEYSRLILKRTNTIGVAPTIPAVPGAGLVNMTPTDTFVGELFANVADDSVWIRTNNGQIPLLLSGTTFTGNTSGGCISDLYVHALHGCSPIEVWDDFILTGSGVNKSAISSFGGNSTIRLDKAPGGEVFDLRVQNPSTPTQDYSTLTIDNAATTFNCFNGGNQASELTLDNTGQISLSAPDIVGGKPSSLTIQPDFYQANIFNSATSLNSILQMQSNVMNLSITDGLDTGFLDISSTNMRLHIDDVGVGTDVNDIRMNKNYTRLEIDNSTSNSKTGKFILDPSNIFSIQGTFIEIADTTTTEQTNHEYASDKTLFKTELPGSWEILDRSEYDGLGEIVKELKTSNNIPSQAYIRVKSKTTSANSSIEIVADDTLLIQSNNVGAQIGMTGAGLSLDCGVGLNYTLQNLPAFQDDAAAGGAGLTTGMLYQTTGTGAAPLNAAGIMMVKQ